MDGQLRAEVVKNVEAHVANEHLRRHMLATEAIMRGLAARLGQDPDLWGLAGSLPGPGSLRGQGRSNQYVPAKLTT